MSVVGWICPECEAQNAYWKNYCADCNHPVRGYDPKPKPVDPDLARLLEVLDQIHYERPGEAPRQPHYFDCGCPKWGYTCNSTACPRIFVTTC
jgi:hypothetical protein